jgi:hypothetical protein
MTFRPTHDVAGDPAAVEIPLLRFYPLAIDEAGVTLIRVPLMQGLPPRIWGSETM